MERVTAVIDMLQMRIVAVLTRFDQAVQTRQLIGKVTKRREQSDASTGFQGARLRRDGRWRGGSAGSGRLLISQHFLQSSRWHHIRGRCFHLRDRGPYTIGYSDSFSANSWRADVLAQLNADVATYKAKGLVSGLTATNSNLDNNLQIQQITSMINQHVSAIIAIPNSPTAFNGVIKQAYLAGIPFITLASHVTSPYAINVDGNYFLTGAMLAGGLAKLIGGHGSVLEVNGINGSPASEALSEGYSAGFARCPGITVAGSVEGQWSEATAKTVSLQFLASHPSKLGAVINSGGMTSAIMQALQQTGRPLVPIGDANPDEGSLVALKNQLATQYVASTIPPQQSINMALQVAIATLQGQQPKFDTIVASPPLVTGKANLDNWVQGGWNVSSTNQAPAPPNAPFFPASELSAFFSNPEPLPALP
jgi:ribose transport system substrate-binding protein